MRILALSRCLGQRERGLYYFHFKGVFRGYRVERIAVEAEKVFELKEDYILDMDIVKLYKGTLFGRVKRSKKI